MKRLLAFALALVLLLATGISAFAAEDVYATRGEVCAALVAAADDYQPGLQAADVLRGYPDGQKRENEPATRAETLVMLQRAFGALPAPTGDSARKGYPAANFTDIPGWAQEELRSVLAAGIVAGTSETTLSPADYVTAEQVDALISRTYALLGTNLKDDFYAAVNKSWLDSADIKPGYSINGTVYELMADTEPLTALIQQAVKNPTDEDSRRISALYSNCLDWDSRNAAGIAPIQKYLDAVDAAATLDALMEVGKLLNRELSSDLLLSFSLTGDAKDSTRHAVSFSTLSPSMAKELYAADAGFQKEAYLNYITKLFVLGGEDETTAAANAALVWDLEKELSPSTLAQQEYGDVDKTYNVYTMAQLQQLFPNVKLDEIYALSGFQPADQILVTDVGLLNAVAARFDDAHLRALKAVAKLGLLAGFGGYLSRDFQDAGNAFQQEFMGISGVVSDEEYATSVVQSLLSDELGRLYAAKYFSPEAKADVEKMVREFIAIYKTKIAALDWMSDATKAKAIEKLDTMNIKVGYPDDDEWNDLLKGVALKTKAEGGSYFENMVAVGKASHQMAVEQQNQPVDKGQWAMSVYTVNACYVFANNEIVFPAGILRAPLYDVNASREENLGGIGYIIAHEITHAFDNNGAKYDKNGNAADWWTAEDYAAFQQLCDKVVTYYDGVEIAPGIACNGLLTLSENIADLGSASCLLQAAKMEADPDLETLFRSIARTWCSTMPRETAAYFTQMDVHSPDKLRGNRVLQTFDEFYEVFGIAPGDGMYVAPADRVSVW